MRKRLAALAVLVPSAAAGAEDPITDLFFQYTCLDTKGSDDPAHTILLIGSRKITDWFSAWAPASEKTLTTSGGHHEHDENRCGHRRARGSWRARQLNRARRLPSLHHRRRHPRRRWQQRRSHDPVQGQPVRQPAQGTVGLRRYFSGRGAISEQWGGRVAFNVSERLTMGYEVMLGDDAVGMTFTLQTAIGGD